MYVAAELPILLGPLQDEHLVYHFSTAQSLEETVVTMDDPTVLVITVPFLQRKKWGVSCFATDQMHIFMFLKPPQGYILPLCQIWARYMQWCGNVEKINEMDGQTDPLFYTQRFRGPQFLDYFVGIHFIE